MSRKHYFDILKDQGFNASVELERLGNFLNTPYYYNATLKDDINNLFLHYSNRGTFLSFKELTEYVYNNSENEDVFLFNFTEMLLDIKTNILRPYLKKLFNERATKHELLVNHLRALERQISDFLERSNHEIIQGIEDRSLIVVKNAEATEASNIISDTDQSIALKILEYNHFSNEGDIDSKRSILIDLGRFFEPKREKLKEHFEGDIFKGGSSPAIISRLFEMVNNLQIRHQNEKQYISLDEKNQLEKWYDATFNTFLFIIISSKQLRVNEEFEKLKKTK